MLIQADAFHLPYPDGYFHACVTSPPYWGLRKYTGDQGDNPLGLEATPQEHIARMVAVFREVRRVLRDDGVLWLNYGDCYYNHRPGKGSGLPKQTIANTDREQPVDYNPRRTNKMDIGSGNLMLMPHRLAIALQDDGWIVRNDAVWYKRNPMPASVAGWRWERKKIKTGRKEVDWSERPKGWQAGLGAHDAGSDSKGHYANDDDQTEPIWEYGDDYVLRRSSWRHTRAHEYVFQMVKKMNYYCNQEAVREAAEYGENRATFLGGTDRLSKANVVSGGYVPDDKGMNRPVSNGRNPRSVLDVPTAPYSGSHYAVFPPNLIAPLIRASVPRRACPNCGAPWAPVVEKNYRKHRPSGGKKTRNERGNKAAPETNWGTFGNNLRLISNVTAYRPTCDCGHSDYNPGIVLDIFGGSGTTGMVAKELLRRWVVMDISRPYLDEQAKVRTGYGSPSSQLDDLPLFS